METSSSTGSTSPGRYVLNSFLEQNGSYLAKRILVVAHVWVTLEGKLDIVAIFE